jgi:hypothetical protein
MLKGLVFVHDVPVTDRRKIATTVKEYMKKIWCTWSTSDLPDKIEIQHVLMFSVPCQWPDSYLINICPFSSYCKSYHFKDVNKPNYTFLTSIFLFDIQIKFKLIPREIKQTYSYTIVLNGEHCLFPQREWGKLCRPLFARFSRKLEYIKKKFYKNMNCYHMHTCI